MIKKKTHLWTLLAIYNRRKRMIAMYRTVHSYFFVNILKTFKKYLIMRNTKNKMSASIIKNPKTAKVFGVFILFFLLSLFSIMAVDAAGNESGKSTAASAATQAAAPSNSTAPVLFFF